MSGYTKLAGLACAALAAAAFAGWSSPETISPPSGKWCTCYNFARSLVADDDGNLHAVFFEDNGGGTYYRRYDRAAGRWEALYRLDEHGRGGRDAALVIDTNGELHAFFNAGGAMYHRVADDAGRWSTADCLTESECRLGKPSPLALPWGDVALAMVGEPYLGRPTHIWFTIWRRETRQFDQPVRLSESTGENGSWMPTMEYFQNEIRLVWRDDSTGEFEIYERKYNGSSWTPTRRLTYDPAPTFHPRLVIDGQGILRLLFMDGREGKPAIWEMVDHGGGWGTEHIIYDGGREAFHPNPILAPDGRLLVFWEDNRETPRTEIFYGSLPAGTWSAAGRVSRTPNTASTLASPAVAAGEVAVAYNQEPGKICVRRLPLDEVSVRIVTFRARPEGGAVELRWDGDGVDDYGRFDVYRRSAAGATWRRINDEAITGRRPYTYMDEAASPGENTYKLEGRTAGGFARELGTARATVGGAAKKFISGLSVSPNPCRGAPRVAWRQEGPAAATVAAYDLSGRRVASASTAAFAGANVLTIESSRLAPGCYVAVLTAGGDKLSTLFVVTR